MYSMRCGSYRMYLEGDSPHQTAMIVYELKWFSYTSNRYNTQTLMQSCNVFHTRHAIFFTTFGTCASAMCVFWIYMLTFFLIERGFWEFKMLFGSLVELHVWLHSCLCFYFLGKLFLRNLNSSSSSASFYRNLNSFSIHRENFCLLDRCSIAPQSIEPFFVVETSR